MAGSPRDFHRPEQEPLRCPRDKNVGRTIQQDMERFLSLKAPPGRLTAGQAAWFLGFSAHEISILVNRGLLKPLYLRLQGCGAEAMIRHR